MYDRGYEQVVNVVDIQLQPTKVEYDEFGRLKRMFRPRDLTLPATLCTAPSVEIDYMLPPDLPPGTNHSVIHTQSPGRALPAIRNTTSRATRT